MKNSYLPLFFREVYSIYSREYWKTVSFSIVGGIIIRNFELSSVIIGCIVFLALVYALFFFAESSLMPSTSSGADRFSWKYLQALPLSKSEILAGLVLQNLFIGSVFLVWLISYFPQVGAFFSDEESFNWKILLFCVVAYFPLMTIISFRSISKQIVYPRKQYSKVDEKVGKLKGTKLILSVSTCCVYVCWLFDFVDPFNSFTLSPEVKKFIKITLETLFSWWGLLPVTAFAFYSFHRTLTIWQTDSYGYNQNSRDTKKDYAIVAFYSLLLIIFGFKNDISTPRHFKDGPFQKSVYNNNWKEIKHFIQVKADINQRNLYGFTPLHIATLNNDFKAYQFLIDHGADPSLPVVGVRDSNFQGLDVMRLAISGDSHRIVEHLLKNKYHVERVNDKSLNTPLHYAASKCKTKMVDQLISNGANVNAINLKGNTPLHIAAYKKCFGVVTALSDAGADPTIKSKDGKLAVQLIEKRHSTEELIYYLDKKTRAPASIKK